MINAGSPVTDITVMVTPYLPFMGVIAGAILVGIFSIWNRKRGALETRAPDVNEIWQQQARDAHDLDMERRMRRRLENLYYDLRRTFLAYIRRVQSGGTMELTATEKHVIESEVHTGEFEIMKPKEQN